MQEKSGNWEGYKEAHQKQGELCERAFMKVKESYDKVVSEDIGRLSVAQNIFRERTDFLRRIIWLVSGVEGVTSSYGAPALHVFSA